MLECVRGQLPVAAGARLHLEVNPEDVTPATVRDWKALGVHMLSMGVQSFDDAELRTQDDATLAPRLGQPLSAVSRRIFIRCRLT